MLADVRMAIVLDHLAQAETPSLADLAHRLGFSEPSAACRFVRARFGSPMRALGALQAGAG